MPQKIFFSSKLKGKNREDTHANINKDLKQLTSKMHRKNPISNSICNA